MGCYYDPVDDEQFRDFSAFVLEPEKERYDALVAELDREENEEKLDDLLPVLHTDYAGYFFYELSRRDQVRFITEVAYQTLLDEQKAAAAVVVAAEEVVAAVEVEELVTS